MVMRYYGGGIGHLNNSLPQQADPPNSNSGKAAMPENAEENIEEDAEDVIMHDEELEEDEQGDGDDEDSTDPEDYDYSKDSDEDKDEDEGSTCSSDEDEEDGSGCDSS